VAELVLLETGFWSVVSTMWLGPACSPDLNPVDHVWQGLGGQVAGQPRAPPLSIQNMVEEDGLLVSQELFL
ncbi:hypothetical protein AVEN_198126-1, partial [Araneus ventricosus]